MNEASFKRISRIAEALKDNIQRAHYPFSKATVGGDMPTRDYHAGDYFGKADGNYDMTATVPLPDYDASRHYALSIATRGYNDDNSRNPQMKLFIGDELVQGLDVNHRTTRVEPSWVVNDQINLRLQIYAGRDDKQFPVDIEAFWLDEQSWTTYFDFMTYLGCWQNVDSDDNLDNRYHRALEAAANLVDLRAPYSDDYEQSLRQASDLLHSQLDEAPDAKNGTIYAIGHTHIDMAWLWPIRQTVEKANRSWATVLNLMKQYPDFQFMHSSPQLYKWIKEKYPEEYAQIKQAVKDGRWEPEGAMWVEPDTNLPSGESLVRQILYGKRFFKKEFDLDSRVLWLPDAFGYTGALPQIMKKAGVDYFMTTKLAWNDTNIWPDTSFYWQGIDGSKVVAHIINTISEFWSLNEWYSTYSGLVTPNVLKKTWDKYRQKDVSDSVLVAYGWGDGGGGPTAEMMEYLKRFKQGIAGMPRIKNAGAAEYFDHLAAQLAEHPGEVPTWMGEMYFEFHRGVFTSLAKNKHNNRAIEALLSATEKLLATVPGAAAHHETLDDIWERTMMNQFHDVLPGSSIKEVYDQTDKDYAKGFAELDKILAAVATDHLTAQTDAITLYNPLGETRDMDVVLPLSLTQTASVAGKPLPVQHLADARALVRVPAAAPFSMTTITTGTEAAAALPAEEPLGTSFETADLAVTFDANFAITSLIDKHAGREVVPAGGKLNELVVYQDLPTEYDAWNIDSTYHAKSWPVSEVVSATIESRGPLEDILHIVRRFGQSLIDQRWHFTHGTTQIAVETDLDWHDDHMLLRSENAVDVNADNATYDIQFGTLKRPVNKNTSWEQAKFEVPAQLWADLSDRGYGLSILTDAKYGYDAAYQHLGLSLHRCPTMPDPEADTGADHFTYTLMPHAGDWVQAGTMQAALALNNQPIVWPGYAASETAPFVTCDKDDVLIDTIKVAEDSDATILRGYEFADAASQATWTFAKPLASAAICDLLENEQTPLTISEDGRSVTVPFKPFEIQTVKVTFK
ncbi:alpha-mannosidase [Lacticaseibacillus mingshuiensis]|uniref:Alpha-mannosidase n=1 Tax=Lacticaseibacillus mingshuiensis TaxID=2799574 RepID=A0ABW4CE95_9LACO|nr:glycoside hydrolase family 38 C-terminal domain-containing protein [Lacticaseibacillus mingshuiensis]